MTLESLPLCTCATHSTRSAGELAETKSVVVYCGWKSAADTLAESLRQSGVNAAAYHAGKTLQQRELVQVGIAV